MADFLGDPQLALRRGGRGVSALLHAAGTISVS